MGCEEAPAYSLGYLYFEVFIFGAYSQGVLEFRDIYPFIVTNNSFPSIIMISSVCVYTCAHGIAEADVRILGARGMLFDSDALLRSWFSAIARCKADVDRD